MKLSHRAGLGIAVAALLALSFVTAQKSAASSPKGEKTRFMVIATHTPEECLKTLDEVKSEDTKLLGKFDWGCMAGDHTGYVVLEAKDEAAVKAMLPADMQNARIVKLNKFTAEQIQSFHAKK